MPTARAEAVVAAPAVLTPDAASLALGQVFNSLLPRMVSQARESSAPARGLMGFGLLMLIARLRAEGVTVTRAELARRLDKSQQMFAPHIDGLVALGLLSMTKVTGGHGVGTQWHLDLVDQGIVDALRPLICQRVEVPTSVTGSLTEPRSKRRRAHASVSPSG